MNAQENIEAEELQPTGFRGGLAEGTNVRTPCGLRRIELVRPGDLIVTRNSGLQPVRMIWQRVVTQNAIQLDPRLVPIRLRPRAIGPMMPQRDLLVAPDHRLLIPGFRLAGMPKDACVLVEAREIAGSSDAIFVDRPLPEVRYYQMVFDRHHVVSADGQPVESFLPNAAALSTLRADLHDDLVQRYPLLRKEPRSYPRAGYQIASDIGYLPHLV